MKTDIILAGVGGQGILSIAASIGIAAINKGLTLKQAEVHGMSQRGGAVESHLRLSSGTIASDLIPMGACDLILSVEPMESLRYLPWLSPKGWIVTNSAPFINIPNYPAVEEIIKEIEKQSQHVILDADALAQEAGSLRASNMVMLGAASPFIDISHEAFEEGICQIFGRKGQNIVDLNLNAYRLGRGVSVKKLKVN
jgi:indolepyruvate ferredoxin oxidoreductase, beta subunit